MALLCQLMQNPRLGVHVVEDHAVCNQVIVLDPLALLRAMVRGDDPFTCGSREPVISINQWVEGAIIMLHAAHNDARYPYLAACNK
jgi:hypothetical protein